MPIIIDMPIYVKQIAPLDRVCAFPDNRTKKYIATVQHGAFFIPAIHSSLIIKQLQKLPDILRKRLPPQTKCENGSFYVTVEDVQLNLCESIRVSAFFAVIDAPTSEGSRR